jgi:hypothetical protein
MKFGIPALAFGLGILGMGPAAAGEAAPKLHPVKEACVSYTSSGQMMNGTSVRCHRDFARESYEIQNMTVGIAGFTQTQKQHTITQGDTIYAIDLKTNTATKTKNPMYEGLVASMKDKDAAEMSEAFMAGMGFAPTGETKTIAEHDCQVHNSAQMGTVCVTADGLMLEQAFMGNTTRATKVEIGTSGDPANYALHETVPVTDGPDLSDMPNLQDLMKQHGPR